MVGEEGGGVCYTRRMGCCGRPCPGYAGYLVTDLVGRLPVVCGETRVYPAWALTICFYRDEAPCGASHTGAYLPVRKTCSRDVCLESRPGSGDRHELTPDSIVTVTSARPPRDRPCLRADGAAGSTSAHASELPSLCHGTPGLRGDQPESSVELVAIA